MAPVANSLEKGLLGLTWIMCPSLAGWEVGHIIHASLLSMNPVNGGGKGSTQKRDAGLIIQVTSTSDYLVLLLSGWIFLPSIFYIYW